MASEKKEKEGKKAAEETPKAQPAKKPAKAPLASEEEEEEISKPIKPLTAEELEKEFKEHSVAEFFKKNRQMLGLVGKIRCLTTIVHEYVTNSVTYETPTVIRAENGIEIKPIGKIADNLMNKDKTLIEQNSGMQSLRNFNKFDVLCFDKKTNKLKFKQVKSIHRHKMQSKESIFEIKAVGNRRVEATRHHSLFVLKNGAVQAIKASELKIGDHVVVPRTAWIGMENLAEINLIEEALKLSDDELAEFSIFGVRKILFADKGLMSVVKSQLPKKEQHYGFYNKYMKCDRLPIRLLRILPKEKREIFYSCTFGARHCKQKLPVILPITKELMQFLGLYAAEGNTRASLLGVSLSFGAHEKGIISFADGIIQKLFGFKPQIKPAHKTAVNVRMNSKSIAFLLTKIFGCGSKAISKRVPSIVFNVSKELASEFLFAYLAGDGYPSEKIFQCIERGRYDLNSKITLATVSKGLSIELQYLLSGLGYAYSLQEKLPEKRFINNKFADFKKSYIIEFYLQQKNSPMNFYPIELGGISAVVEPRLKYAINKRNQQFVTYEKGISLIVNGANVSEEAVAFLNGDLGVLQITEINEREASEDEFVYDYSVEDDENFIGGFGALCLHNSLDACEESGILPDIDVTLTELAPEHYEVTVVDNGPGLTQESVGKAFGQLLAGTKFHRLMQMRGQQGIGAAGCTVFAQMTTGKPVKVITGSGKGKPFAVDVAIDTKTNQAKLTNIEMLQKDFKGTAVRAEFKGVLYRQAEQNAYEYLRRTAVANPHAKISFKDPTGKKIIFKRTVSELPERPKEIKPHPKGATVDELLSLSKYTEARKISSFLKSEFERFGDKALEEVANKIHFDLNKDPKKLVWAEAEEIINAIKAITFLAPSTEGLRPIGEDRIRKSLVSIVKPEFLSVITRKPQVYAEGFPFQIEVGIAYGGEAGRANQNGTGEQQQTRSVEIMRFANRAPLLFDSGGCAITKAVQTIEWKRYGVKDLENVPLTVFVNLISVHVPYTSAGKQAIAEEEEIIEEIRLALMDTGRKTARYITNKQKEYDKKIRRETFYKYIPEIASALHNITKEDEKKLREKLEKLVTEKLKIIEKQEAEEAKEDTEALPIEEVENESEAEGE